MKIKVGIIGGAGYTGGELIRLLVNHPHAEIKFINSRSNAGKPVSSVHQDLVGEALVFSADVSNEVDVLFLCLGHGESKKFLQEHTIDPSVKVIDLANDFRLSINGQRPTHNGQPFIYGLPELNKEEIKKGGHIANPGCFATAIQLGLLPLAKAGLLGEVYTTGITGSTGAGQSLSSTSHFSWRANNIQAYKTLTHQHLGEIGESLLQLQPNSDIAVNFVPWRGDFTRGIFISSQVHTELTLEELNALYEDFYREAVFTHVVKEPLFLKQVVNTNKCLIQLEKVGSLVVIHSVIDNLLKGASGQAVQNMNLLFGLEETAGLKLKATYY
ncbi:MAG: N-acetyl-gamma-glutamyl-phosphate reductase [Chitinophagaceae bacterium]